MQEEDLGRLEERIRERLSGGTPMCAFWLRTWGKSTATTLRVHIQSLLMGCMSICMGIATDLGF